MICIIKDKEYVAPENDKWRHDDSNSDNEDSKMNELVEKKTSEMGSIKTIRSHVV